MKTKPKLCSLAVLSGLAAFAAFPPLDISFLAWVAFIPLLYVIANSGLKSAFWYSYLAGVVFFGGVLHWLTVVSVPGAIILVVVLAFFYALFGVVAKLAIKYSLTLFAIPLIWIVMEYLRANLFTGFPWALLGYSQYRNINIIQVADITGAYGVSFLVMMFNTAMYATIFRHKRKVMYMMSALLMMIAATTYGMYSLEKTTLSESVKISVVQGNISQALKWDLASSGTIIEKYLDLTATAAMDRPDVIIWPETAYPYLVNENDIDFSEMARLSADTGIPVLSGVVYDDGGVYYNSAVLFEGGKRTVTYSKLHLVPFGEYVPFEKFLGPLRGLINKPIGDFASGDKYELFPVRSVRESEGPGNSIVRKTVFHKMGVLICFEDVFPYVARNFVRQGARILVNITNDAWFGDTAASRQHLQCSVFRAVENRVPVVRSANTGISGFVDFNGRIISLVKEGKRETFVAGYATSEVMTVPGKSYYTVKGDMAVFFSMWILALFAAARYFSYSKKL